jgi:hypothetical protein
MTYLPRFPVAKGTREHPAAGAAHRWLAAASRLSSTGKWISAFIETLTDYYAATAMYEQLSRLSDAELQRRGLSRSGLARDVLAACERRGPDGA